MILSDDSLTNRYELFDEARLAKYRAYCPYSHFRIDVVLKRRDLLIQRLRISEESCLKYVKTINDTFQIIKRTIEPYYYGDNLCIYDNREASNV
ncbi:unnamed protein product [Rotaria sp. Silwood2]|nr:unnamed protein product [Rotaria sp. Silwood2]